MAVLELPHTAGCLVCGRENPHGLHLHLHVDEQSGQVETRFTPAQSHIGFEGIVHGGVLATILDEAMVWTATWQGKRFCVCGELTVRFKRPAQIGRALKIVAAVTSARGRMITTSGAVTEGDELIASAGGKYMALPDERHRQFVATLIEEAPTQKAGAILRQG